MLTKKIDEKEKNEINLLLKLVMIVAFFTSTSSWVSGTGFLIDTHGFLVDLEDSFQKSLMQFMIIGSYGI